MKRVIALLAVWRAVAAAHSFEPAVLDLREHQPGIYDVIWRSPTPRAPGDGAAFAVIQPRFSAACRGTPAGGDVEEGAPVVFQLDCRPSGLRGQTVAIDGIEGTRVDAIIRIAWRDGSVTTGVARSGEERFVVPGVGNGVPAGEVLFRYGRLGIEHILGGTDHLLFVLGLLLLVERTGALVRTVTAFTVAHSVTLACAVLGLVEVPPAPVEALIALSIVLLAAELARPPARATLARRAPWVVAFTFGLLHGLGFAGALAAVGLPADQVPLALFAFNVGVEIGQLAFVAAMLLPVALWRRSAARGAWRLGPAYAIGTVAMAWTIERVRAFFG